MSTLSPNRDFIGKTVLVTGSNRNTGLAIAKAFYASGARVYVNARSADKANAAVKDIGDAGPGIAIPLVGDVSVAEDIIKMFAEIKAAGHGLHVLVNNAVIQGIGGSFDTVTDEEFAAVINTNVFGYFRVARAAAQLMKSLPADDYAIINISSNTAKRAIRNRAAYVTSKGAIDSLTLAMSLDLAPKIRVNSVVPGYINTERWDVLPDGVAERRRANIPLHSEATGHDVAEAVMFLASPRARNTTGARLLVDGGVSAQNMPECEDL